LLPSLSGSAVVALIDMIVRFAGNRIEREVFHLDQTWLMRSQDDSNVRRVSSYVWRIETEAIWEGKLAVFN
jgi:hypothetical protein